MADKWWVSAGGAGIVLPMSTFDSTKLQLGTLLDQVVAGKLQLPDFQRGWVWDDEHIRALLVSIARSFPIGAVMLLETGGSVRFQVRPVEGVELPKDSAALAEQLILDGQQRLTSLTQVLKLAKPVTTRDEKKRSIHRHYYFDIEKALGDPQDLHEAVIAVDEKHELRSDFGRKVDLDLSSTEKEIVAFHFPCSQILDSSSWEYALMTQAQGKFMRFLDFRQRILEPFRSYLLPVITLKRDTSKEAVCLVFEKVNTGGVQLSVFELVTASWAADGYNLREDWFGARGDPGRHTRLSKKVLLRDLQATDFLQGISLLASHEERERKIADGFTAKDLPPVTAKRDYILGMKLAAYTDWAERLTVGFEQVDRFLRRQGFHDPKFLPYRSQLAPLAAVMARIGDRWLEPRVEEKLARWYWCGVLGELYGGAVETRMALDFSQLLAWAESEDAAEPATVQASSFTPNRLDTLRSRTSAAYRGLYVLLQREGACDFFWKSRMVDLDKDEYKIDVHHIFPRAWCEKRGIAVSTYNAIVNKTAISYKANRKIGGNAPSKYLKQLEDEGVDGKTLDTILTTHHIDPKLLRADDFEAFYHARKEALLTLIEKVMGKVIVPSLVVAGDEMSDDEGDDT